MKNIFNKIKSAKYEKLYKEYGSYCVLSDDEKDYQKLKALKDIRCAIDVGLSFLAFTIAIAALMISACIIN